MIMVILAVGKIIKRMVEMNEEIGMDDFVEKGFDCLINFIEKNFDSC